MTKISAFYKKNDAGEYITEVRVDGVLVRSVPTPASEVRVNDKSYLWRASSTPVDRTFIKMTRKM